MGRTPIRLNYLASRQGKKLRVLPFISRGEPRDEDDNSIEEMSDHKLFDHTDARSSSDSDNEDSEDDDEDDDDDESVNYFKDTDTADELEPDPV